VRIAVLGASGATGRLLVEEALARGHEVVALVRDPARFSAAAGVHVVAADVTDPASVLAATATVDVVVSGLGAVSGSPADLLRAGARALAGGPRTVWLGAFGTGDSAAPAGAFTRAVLRLAIGREIADKVAADAIVRSAGGSVLHAGPLTDGPRGRDRRTVPLGERPRKLFPRRVSRATVAAAMLDEAEHPRFAGGTGVPLQG
jgi:uncharacterized protein YbjT (DUF2867 family)